MSSIPAKSDKPLVVWRFTDGKPGHESQSLGLVAAMSELREVETHDLRVDSSSRVIVDWIFCSSKIAGSLPRPDFLLGAGHATHWALLAAKRKFGGKTIVLMKPSLPLSWFDYCIVPKHDKPPVRPNITTAEGVLNPIRPALNPSAREGLILIGGESAHYVWDDARIESQLAVILESKREMNWTLTTSRRTPDSTVRMLRSKNGNGLTVVPHDQTAPGWVAEQLAICGEVWVTPDSMSMLYEAMSASSKVGLFRMEAKRSASRVVRAVDRLLEDSRLSQVKGGRIERPQAEVEPLSEASRIAGIILEVSPK
jgi:mitochondrial fission protein ELM1